MHDSFRHHSLYFLRHHTHIGTIAAVVAKAIVAKAVRQMAEQNNIVLERDIRPTAAATAAAATTTTSTTAAAEAAAAAAEAAATAGAQAATTAGAGEACAAARRVPLSSSAGSNVTESVTSPT